MIGRPRTFDPEVVLETALDVFWEKGFESTSMMDLVNATGLHKGSLYKAFGDKKGIFIAALEMYLERNFKMAMDVVMAAPSMLEGLHESVHAMFDVTVSEGCHRGCMAMNTMIEMYDRDEKVEQILQKHFGKIKQFATAVLTQAEKDGLITLKTTDVNEAVMLMMALKSGLESCVKGWITSEQGHQLIDAQMKLMGIKP